MGDSGDHLLWTGSGFVSQTYELRDADTVLLTLAFADPLLVHASADTPDGELAFDRDTLLGRTACVTRTVPQQPAAKLRYARRGRCDVVTADAHQYRVEGTWGASRISTEDGRPLFEYRAVRPRDMGHQTWTMETYPDADVVRHPLWLALIGWYVTVSLGWNRPEPVG